MRDGNRRRGMEIPPLHEPLLEKEFEMTVQVKRSIGELVDTLGEIKAAMADLAAREELIADLIKSQGDGDYDGALFHANVSTSERSVLNKDAMLAKLEELMPKGSFTRFVNANTETKSVTVCKVNARSVAKAQSQVA